MCGHSQDLSLRRKVLSKVRSWDAYFVIIHPSSVLGAPFSAAFWSVGVFASADESGRVTLSFFPLLCDRPLCWRFWAARITRPALRCAEPTGQIR